MISSRLDPGQRRGVARGLFRARENWRPDHHGGDLAAHVRFLADDLLEGRAPASRGSELALRYIAAQYERLGLVPAGDGGSWLQRFDIVGMKSEVTPPTLSAAPGKKPLVLQPLVESMSTRGCSRRRGRARRRRRLRRLRHHRARAEVGRFEGRRRARQGRARHEQRSRRRPGALRRQDAALLRPLGLQVRRGRAPRRRRRHHHPHLSFGELSVARRAVELERHAVRAAGDAAEPRVTLKMWATEDAVPAHRAARRQGSRRAAPRRRAARLQPGRARRQADGGDQGRRCRARARRTCSANCRAATEAGERGRRRLGASRSSRRERRKRRHHLQRRARQRVGRGGHAQHRRGAGRAASRGRSDRSSSPPSLPKNRASRAANISARIRWSRPARSRRT